VEPDIVARIATDFPAADRAEALRLLELLASEVGGQPRVLRCVLFLARGDLARLAHNADRARSDWRDVIYWAEYDEQDRRVRDFDRPFPNPTSAS
jgi:hypothetical protein